MSIHKVRNYNMSYEQLLDAVNEFEGFITGGGVNNQLLSFGIGEDILGIRFQDFTDAEVSSFNEFLKEISSRILDRTTGTYYMGTIMGGKAISTVDWAPKKHQGLIEFMHLNEKLKAPFLTYKHDVFNPSFYAEDNEQGSAIRDDAASTREVVAGLVPENMSVEEVPEKKADKQKEKQKTKKPTKHTVLVPSGEKLKRHLAEGGGGSKTPPIPSVNNSADFKVKDGKIAGEPDRFLAPSLGAIVCKHSKLNFQGKKAQHLSVFFNAVNPIEMSRCTPFLSMTVMTERLKAGTTAKKMNNVSYWNFVRNEKGRLVLDDGIGMEHTQPLQSEGNEALTDLIDSNISLDHSYMDIFTAPQLAANANINSAGSINDFFKQKGGKVGSPSTTVLEPIMPMMTINSLTVSISGNGYGMMASKVASLKLTLHDRSRLKELAPLISSDKFSSTKIMLEYGWSHPDSGPASSNTLGRYLGALRDVGLFTVRGVDYSFSGGNSVTIDIKLTCSGFNESKSIPAAAGDHVPLFMIKDFVDRTVNDLVESLEDLSEVTGAEEKFPEVRSVLKSRQRNAKSPVNLIPHVAFQEFIRLIKEYKMTKPAAQSAIMGKIADKISGIIFPAAVFSKEDDSSDTDGLWSKAKEQEVQTGNNVDAAQRLFAKLYACKQNVGPDPFVGSFIAECKSTKNKVVNDEAISLLDIFPKHSAIAEWVNTEGRKDTDVLPEDLHHVTLGKLCMMFIGYPLSTCGLYDEVQVIFYPMNHQSAGARKHTTASFPMPYNKVEAAFLKHIEQTSRLSVHGAFGIFEKILRDRNNEVYGFQTSFQDLNNYKEASDEDKQKLANAYCEGVLKLDISKMEAQKVRDEYRQYLIAKQQGDVTANLTAIYGDGKNVAGDGVEFKSEDKFVIPNISMFFEVVPVVDSKASDNQAAIFNGVRDAFKRIASDDVHAVNSKGFKPNRSILRVHIYDEESVSAPSTLSMGNVLYEGQTSYLLGDDPPGENALQKTTEARAKLSAKTPDGEDAAITKAVKKLSFGEIKQFVKREFPSITYGASTGTINSINVSGQTSGQLANVVMVEQYGKKINGQTAQDKEDSFEEVTMFPGSISINMMGMPMISRGENIFVDFGTDTSLDNVYVVKSVVHSIESGKFTTNLECVNANQGAIRSFRNTMIKKVTELTKGK